jgi:spore coat polysaccharide biosynthesis protein SpsF
MKKLVAALAVRNEGSRLYGKPLQNLDVENSISIIDHIVSLLLTVESIDSVVLGISEGDANKPFIDYATSKGIAHIIGSEKDVLMRLIQCVDHKGGTDAFRITTESPFPHFDMIDEAWDVHVKNNNDVTAIDGLPEGCFFEIYSLNSLKKSHDLGLENHRSEYCSLYIRENINDFKIEILPIPESLNRIKDFRLTVDYPEDLVVCRRVYMALKEFAPRIPVQKIIEFLDSNPELIKINEEYIYPHNIW